MSELVGIFPATVTPFDNDGAFDAGAMRRIVRHQLGAGVHGLYVCGGTGEGLLLTTAEHRAVIETVVDEVAGKVPVVSHVGAFQTAETLARARDARAVGVDAVAALPPAYFYKPDDEGLLQYYSVLAEAAAPLPLLIYNIPQRTGVAMTPELYARMLEIENIVGMKDSTGDVYAIGQFVSQRPEAVLFGGADSVLLGTPAGWGTRWHRPELQSYTAVVRQALGCGPSRGHARRRGRTAADQRVYRRHLHCRGRRRSKAGPGLDGSPVRPSTHTHTPAG